MELIGKKGIFNASEDKAWGSYAGKECVVIKYDDVVKQDAVLVEFEDGVKLTIGVDEFDLILN